MQDLKRIDYGTIFLLFMGILSHTLYAKGKTDFKSLRAYILSEVAARDINEAFIYTDTLASLAETKRELIQTDMVHAVLYYQQGDKNLALRIAMDAEQSFINSRNYADQIGVIGFIASNFRELGLDDEALYYLKKAKPSINKLSSTHLKGQYGTLIHHESIGIYTDKGDYQKVKQNLEQAYAYVEDIEPGKQRDYFLATTIKLDAANQYNLGNYATAKQLYNKSLEVLGTKEELLYGEIQLGLARIALQENRFDRSLNLLEEVNAMVDASQFFQLKKELYKAYMDYYEVVDDSLNYDKSRYLYLHTLHKNDDERKKAANKALLQLRTKMAAKKITSQLFLIVSGASIAILILAIVFLYKRNKRQTARFNYVVEQLKSGGNLVSEEQLQNLVRSDATPAQNHSQSVIEDAISNETEERILTSLKALEADIDFFINPEIALPRMASELDTNTKYLTYIIRKHRGKNFNTYINDLRVNHILKLLQKDPKFLQYKISYLAEVAGFSSHSKFSTEFKRVVGMSPSVFINKMSKNDVLDSSRAS